MILNFKGKAWPAEVEEYREVNTREPLYITEEGIPEFRTMSYLRRVISGSGSFLGAKAYEQYRQLEEWMEEISAGELFHPDLGLRNCYFTGLRLEADSREDYVHYSFEFLQADENGDVPR